MGFSHTVLQRTQRGLKWALPYCGVFCGVCSIPDPMTQGLKDQQTLCSSFKSTLALTHLASTLHTMVPPDPASSGEGAS